MFKPLQQVYGFMAKASITSERKKSLSAQKAARYKRLLERGLHSLTSRVAERWHRSRYAFQGRRVVHLLHIRKTGGTALIHAFERYPPQNNFGMVLHRHNFTLPQVPLGDAVVFVLRDPVSRFVSGFYDRQRQGRPCYDYPWSNAERIAFTRFPSADALARALYADDTRVREQAREAVQSMAHLRLQYANWLGSVEYLNERRADILYVGRQETLAGDFLQLKHLLGLPDVANLPDDGVIAHRRPSDTNHRLSDLAVSNLRRWYAKDYELLRACDQIREETSRDYPQRPSQARAGR